MQILTFLIQVAGATLLLLFAVRMLRTGIERAFGPSLQRLITTERPVAILVPVGVLLAMVLQSSAAVALLVSGFFGTGTIAFLPGMAIVLGADLGSALLIMVLSLRVDLLVPILLTIGGFIFLKAERRRFRQYGRIILGIAFILIALRFLREAVEPVQSSGILPALATYLERDFMAAFIAGAALAFVMHSSVAVILMCVAIVGIGALPVTVGLSLILGANLGSALIPVWLTRGMDPACRRIPTANLIIRGSASILAVGLVNTTPVMGALPDLGPGATLVAIHIFFNGLVVLALPLAAFLERPLELLLPDTPPLTEHGPLYRSHLDDTALDTPVRALACLKREIIRMTDVLSGMLTPVIDLYSKFDLSEVRSIRSEDAVLNRALDRVRLYASAMPHDTMSKPELKEMRALVDYAIALEAAGDVLVKRILPLVAEKEELTLRFSEAGEKELRDIHERVVRNLETASNVLVSGDVEGARMLLEEKAEMGRIERKSRKKHLHRLSEGDRNSLGSSDIHIETAYLLKEMNSWIVTVAHPILVREGQLLETRLIKDLPSEG